MANNNISNHLIWDDDPIDVTSEVNFIWSIANKLRGPYQSDKYKDVIIPMVIIRRFECALEKKLLSSIRRILLTLQKQCVVSQNTNSITPRNTH